MATFAFGVVFGLAARQAGLSLGETAAMSVFVFAGAAQFAAVGLLAAGVAWPVIVILTALLNARHLLYSASLAPWLRARSRRERAGAAYLLTDESFGLSLAAFQRLGAVEMPSYLIAGLLIFVPWQVSTILGWIGGDAVPSPSRLGLDVVAPAAFAGLAVGLVSGRRELVAAVAGAAIAIGVGLATQASVGIAVGGLCGSAVALVVPGPPPHRLASSATEAPR